MEDPAPYVAAPETPRMQPQPLTPGEFELIKLLRRSGFFDGTHDKTLVLRRERGRARLFRCEQV